MSDKQTLMRAFNKQFFDFLDDIIAIFPNNKDITVAKTSFDTVKRANPTAILKVWYKYVYVPYKEIIETGNIEFFFEKDYGEDLAVLSNSNDIMKIIDKIRKPVREMDDVNKEHSMKYIQILSKLSCLHHDIAA